ncbi:MAG: tryptophan 7-halogenase [Ardenticatenaceae bacterium]
MTPTNVDIAIIGGGPAGTAMAIALRQANSDLTIAVLEASDYSGFRVGETVPPTFREPLQQLGLWEVFAADGHQPSLGTSGVWGGPEVVYQDFLFHPMGHGWCLDRNRFERTLAREAQARGATVTTGVRLIGHEQLADGSWQLTVRDRARQTDSLRASFVVDASGHRAMFASKQGSPRLWYDHLVGVSGLFTLPDTTPSGGQHVRIEACEQGWWYAAKLPNKQAVVTWMSDRDIMRQHESQRPEPWTALLNETHHIQELVADATMSETLQVHSAASCRLRHVVGPNWIAIGDAACTFDPLSSAGITKAMDSALSAAPAVSQFLAGDSAGLAHYEQQFNRQHKDYLKTRKAYYAQEQRWPNSAFWQRRQEHVTLSPFQKIQVREGPAAKRKVDRAAMYLSSSDLQRLCHLCEHPRNASDVVATFQKESKESAPTLHILLALQYLIERDIIALRGT